MCNNRTSFKSFKKLRRPKLIVLGDDSMVSITHHGLVDASQGYEMDALYTPTFRLSLFSINQLDFTGSTATFGGGKCSISSPQSLITITSHRVNDLYFISPNVASAHTACTSDGLPSTRSNIDSSTISKAKSTRRKRTRCTLTTDPTSLSPNAPLSAPTSTSTSPPITATKSKSTRKTLTIKQSSLWHRRFAHMHPTSVRSLISEYTNDDSMCTVCIQTKHKQKFIRVRVKHTSRPFEMVHSDVRGPFCTPTFGGNKHFIIFVDDYTRFTFVRMLPVTKSEACTTAYKAFQARVTTLGCQIRWFRCDNGRGEYDNKTFRSLLTATGTTYEPCLPYSHDKNGVAGGMICTITKKARAMMIDCQAPIQFWGEAVNTAVYLHQRSPNEGLTKRDD
jgi:hypothetical protein